jgi:hypothetical protein
LQEMRKLSPTIALGQFAELELALEIGAPEVVWRGAGRRELLVRRLDGDIRVPAKSTRAACRSPGAAAAPRP